MSSGLQNRMIQELYYGLSQEGRELVKKALKEQLLRESTDSGQVESRPSVRADPRS